MSDTYHNWPSYRKTDNRIEAAGYHWDPVLLEWIVNEAVDPNNLRVNLSANAPAAVSVGVASGQVLAANTNRKGCLLVNTSVNYISLSFGAAAVLYSGITINPSGGSFWMDGYSFTTAEIRAIASGATSNLSVQEFE